MKIVEPDFERRVRCGIPEVIYGASKDAETIKRIIAEHVKAEGRAIATKVDGEKLREMLSGLPEGVEADYEEVAQVLVVEKPSFNVEPAGSVGVITAGTSDIPVALESSIIAAQLGLKVVRGFDVGVAGIHRLYPVLKKMTEVDSIIVAAGMEGALPSVVSGLVDVPVIGVPTSVGYGVGRGGHTALHAMLCSCTPVAVVNIDNGYGAAVIAYQISRRSK